MEKMKSTDNDTGRGSEVEFKDPVADRPSFAAKYSAPLKQTFFEKFTFQVKLLIWKRYAEIRKETWDLLKYIMPPLLFFSLLILLYAVIPIFDADGIEEFFVPLAFWIFVQKNVVNIMYEKSNRLQEAMRMMGLMDSSYWISYFIRFRFHSFFIFCILHFLSTTKQPFVNFLLCSDGIILGFILSFLCSLFSIYGLFNHANFGVVLGLLFSFCLAAVPFGFFLCCFFDTPQTSGQATIAILLGKLSISFRLKLLGRNNPTINLETQNLPHFIKSICVLLFFRFNRFLCYLHRR